MPIAFLWVILSCITHSLVSMNPQVSAHSIFSYQHPYGPPVNVTKHLFFPHFDPDSIKLLGSATISNINGSDGLIQIPNSSSPTVDGPNQAGRAIYSSPIRLFDPHSKTPASFTTTFSFRFAAHGGAGSGSGGNGFAFVLVPDEFTIGRPGPWLGMLNDACAVHEKFFAVEFDTNHDRDFGNPDDDHVGVDLGSVVSYKTANASVSLRDDSVLRAWIAYDGGRRWIDVRLGLDSGPYPGQPVLSLELDLAPFLQEYMFVGFSASTGTSAELINVLTWNFSSSIQGLLREPSKKTCRRNVDHQVSRYSESSPSNRLSAFMMFVAVVGLGTATWVVVYFNGRTRTGPSPIQLVLTDMNRRPLPPIRPRRFAISEVSRLTKRFSKTEVLGSDPVGVMYRGTMPNGCFVTVKRFSAPIQNRSRVLKKIEAMVQSEHPNLAPIRGWCFESRETIIVYGYYQNGTLEKWLYGVGVLPWSLRFKLINDIAESLSFLHLKELAHGNLSASTVFLDSNYRAVLGNYGLPDSGRDESVSGEKADVFGFGALVVEMVAGKKTAELVGGEDPIGSLEFAWSMHERGEMVKVVDERIGSGSDSEQAIRVLEIGLSCTLEISSGRPSMDEVCRFMSMHKPIPKLPPSRPANTDSSP